MDIVELIQNNGKCGFSFEVLPPLKGKGIVQIYNAIDKLNEFDPLYINITTHRSEYVFKSNDDGTYQPCRTSFAAVSRKWKQNMR